MAVRLLLQNDLVQSKVAVQLISLVLLIVTGISTYSNSILSTRILRRVRLLLYFMAFYLTLEAVEICAELYPTIQGIIATKLCDGITFAMAPWVPYLVAITFYESIWEKKACMIPLIIDSVVGLSSIWTGWYFSVTPDNVYQRGPYFWVSAVATLYPIILFLYANYKIRYRYDNREKKFVTLLFTTAFAGVVIQLVFPSMRTMWTMTACAIVAFYEFLTQHGSKYDTMTFAGNRSSYAARCKEITEEKQNAVVIMADLNNLKYVNDNLGHSVGDKYIVAAADVLTETYGRYGRVYRIGGDEFVVITSLLSDKTLLALKEQAQHSLMQLTAGYVDKEHAGLAIGYYMNVSGGKNIEECCKKADALMYEDKERLKSMASLKA